MKLRDLEYIENRLLAPAMGAQEAIERLREIGASAEADQLMAALITFTDSCRAVRRQVVEKARAER